MKNPTALSSRRLRALLLGSATAALAACSFAAPPRSSRLVSMPPPALANIPPGTKVSLTSPDAALTPTGYSTVFTTQDPRGALPETRPPQPSPSNGWVSGYWNLYQGEYLWITGHWSNPPFPNAEWVPPTATPEGNSYRLYAGYWR